MKVLALDTRPLEGPAIGQYIANTTGHTTVPVLFVGGRCVGDYTSILNQARNDQLRTRLTAAGVKSVVHAIPLPTLEANIYGYPKALVEGQEGNRRGNLDSAPLNVLVGCCGSSAADKIPNLIERCVAKGWSVKLLCTSSGEHFFKSFGMGRIIKSIGAENVYRDEDEWSFEYDRFGMPVRACHLALRKWADVMVVAPITCNSMAKAVAGIGDNLLSSVFVAWEFQRKKLILCPACNVDMWNNAPTQRNVDFLKQMGAEFLGPRVDRLTNGQVAIGCMETVDNIVDRLNQEEEELLSGDEWYWRRAKLAASQQEGDTLWNLVARAVEEKLLGVNSIEVEYGNTLLHFAAGGESMIDQNGKFTWGYSNLKFLKKVIMLGADVNIRNKFGLAAIHVAISADDSAAVEILLGAGADCQGVLIDFPDMQADVRNVVECKPESAQLATKYYFTYGSLKRGFPNYEDQAKHLQKFIGKATTVVSFPLVVPLEPSCTNPNCPYLHKQASLVDIPGVGKRVLGEVFEVGINDISAFDKLEGFKGVTSNQNHYSRKVITVEIEGKGTVKAYVYFSTDEDPMTQVKAGKAEFVDNYLLSMSKGELKPSFQPPSIDRRTLNQNFLSRMSTVAKPAERTMPNDVPLEGSFKNRRLTQTPLGRYSDTMKEKIGSVQQTINTCNLASITLALKGLDISCTVNDIFLALRLPVGWVVQNGLTLAQVFDVMVKICGSTNEDELLAPGVSVECFHFDEGIAELDSFHEYLKLSLSQTDGVLIANFNTKIVHNMEQGGGHFSIVSGYDEETKMVSIADVHPLKYTAHWACSLQKLFCAMTDKDSSSKRARGLIRVALSTAKRIPNLDACHSSVNFCDPEISKEEQLWLSCWGNLRGFDFHINMGGLSALALALSGFLSEEDFVELAIQNPISSDALVWMLRLDVTALLSTIIEPQTLTEYTHSAIEALSLDLSVYSEEADLDSADSLSVFLGNHIGGEVSGVALVLVDINKALGFEAINLDVKSEASALDHGRSHWCILISVWNNDTAIIADPRAQSYGSLWKCKLENLQNGLLAQEGRSRVVIIRSERLSY